jgi:signal transduction histidine kinase
VARTSQLQDPVNAKVQARAELAEARQRLMGLTTKRDGHGFGLHSEALAAQQMGGALWAESEGPGRGATFVLELPSAPDRASRRGAA